MNACYTAGFEHEMHDSAKLKGVITHMLFKGTHFLLVGKYSLARTYASFSNHFKQHLAIEVERTQPSMHWGKTTELWFDPDQHTLVKYLRENIPCSCLDEKYKQVKSITKMGN